MKWLSTTRTAGTVLLQHFPTVQSAHVGHSCQFKTRSLQHDSLVFGKTSSAQTQHRCTGLKLSSVFFFFKSINWELHKTYYPPGVGSHADGVGCVGIGVGSFWPTLPRLCVDMRWQELELIHFAVVSCDICGLWFQSLMPQSETKRRHGRVGFAYTAQARIDTREKPYPL